MNQGTTPPPSPLVSIVLTTFNGARFLAESIDSCLGQTHPSIELIVVDGGSTDGTLEVVASYAADPRVRLLHQQDNADRLPGAINLGLDAALGEYVTWTQDDCRYQPEAVARMLAVLEADPACGQVYSDFSEIDARGEVVATHAPCEPDEILSARHDPLGVCFLLRRSVRQAVGPHAPWSYPCQDFDYRIRIAKRFPSRHLPEVLYAWRSHGDSLTGRLGWPTLARKDVEIRLRHGLLAPGDRSRELAGIDAAEAFEAYGAGQWAKVPGLALSATRYRPSYLANRGLWAIAARSIWRSLGGTPRAAQP